jgi:hypothetical protein
MHRISDQGYIGDSEDQVFNMKLRVMVIMHISAMSIMRLVLSPCRLWGISPLCKPLCDHRFSGPRA